jgi:mutual gliding-motility protein MglA
MVVYNYQDREITGKIVYFGPHGVGKSTTLRHIYDRVDEEARGKLMSASTDDGRMLYFDFLPVNVGEITGMKIRFQLVTAPGSAHSEATWRRVLQGADAIVFVADSDPNGLQENRESYEFLMEQLEGCGVDSERIPLIFQLNKRDLGTAVSVEQINHELNLRRVPWFASSATQGEGVLETFQTIGRMLLVDIGRRYKEELLRKKREQIQRAQTPAAPAEAAEPEEETRAIRLQEAAAARRALFEDEAPTRLVDADEIDSEEDTPAPAAPEPAPDEAAGAASAMGPPPGGASSNGRGAASAEQEDESDEPTSAALHLSAFATAPGEPEGAASGAAPGTASAAPELSAAGIQAVRSELARLQEQSLRLLETQAQILRRIEEIRLDLERLGA